MTLARPREITGSRCKFADHGTETEEFELDGLTILPSLDSQAKLSFPPTVIPSPILLSNFFPLSRNSSPPTNSNLKRIPIPISFLISLNPYYPPSRLISLKAFNPDESFSDFENTFSKYLSESSFNPRIKVAANAGRGWKKIPYPRNLFSLESKKIELSVSTIHNRSIHFS